jgi:predicted secreted acid phosphatase
MKNNQSKIIFVDIDETICENPIRDRHTPKDYSKSTPLLANVQFVNKLYDNGHKIVYWTARGSQTGLDWHDLTENQLKEWGCKYHELRLGKPAYDIFIDDKAINTSDWEILSRIIS